jgi:hypothetical protein
MGGWSPYWVHSALRSLLVYCTRSGWLWGWRSWWNERFGQGKPKYSEKTCPNTTLFATNPTCQTRARTQAAAVGSQRLTASAMARPHPKAILRLEELGQLKKKHLIGTSTRYLPACSIVSQPTMLPRASLCKSGQRNGSHYFSKNLAAPEIELGASGSVGRNLWSISV